MFAKFECQVITRRGNGELELATETFAIEEHGESMFDILKRNGWEALKNVGDTILYHKRFCESPVGYEPVYSYSILELAPVASPKIRFFSENNVLNGESGRTISVKRYSELFGKANFLDTIKANVDNEKQSDEEFRAFVRNTLPLFYPKEEEKA